MILTGAAAAAAAYREDEMRSQERDEGKLRIDLKTRALGGAAMVIVGGWMSQGWAQQTRTAPAPAPGKAAAAIALPASPPEGQSAKPGARAAPARAALVDPAAGAASVQVAGPTAVSGIVVTASRVNLLGIAETASQGSVTQTELNLRPVFRVGQLLETTPGLIVTVHSGEGKANQYLIRGFNLDHGTDIANFVDDMPVNRPTNTHGQGYSDMNFFMPELAAGLDYTKGPYYAPVGDFGAVASTHTRLLNDLPSQMSLSAGTLGDQNVFLGGTHRFGEDDRLLWSVDYGHLDGPWKPPENFQKLNAALRYSHGTDLDGDSITAMYYHSHGLLTTDQPLRAIQERLISPYGTLDPSDTSRSERFSLSGHYATRSGNWQITINGYYIHSRMTLWNDFTHVLDDPINGDQEQQDENRTTWGAASAFKFTLGFGRVQTDTVVGVQGRYDDVYVDRRHTIGRAALGYCEQQQPTAPDGSYVPALAVPALGYACQADRVHLGDLGPYAETTTHWTDWLRTIAGVREEYYAADDHSFISGFRGSESQTLFQPKGSLVLGPFYRTELYLSSGKGFHSDDVRGVFGTVPLEGEPVAAGKTPLLARAAGEEVGLRSNFFPRLALELVVFQEDFESELAYNQDQGQDTASAPSRREGVEVSGQYHPLRWLELNADFAFSKARYRGDYAAFGFAQPYIANAPTFIGSFGLLVNDFGPWFGGLQWRDLGPYPINDGSQYPMDKGFNEFNVDAGYRIDAHLKAQISIYNLTNSHADAAAYYYTSRLKGEPLGGLAGFQVHALEPISARFSVTATF